MVHVPVITAELPSVEKEIASDRMATFGWSVLDPSFVVTTHSKVERLRQVESL